MVSPVPARPFELLQVGLIAHHFAEVKWALTFVPERKNFAVP
jgi:hypothetical protein